MHLAQSEIEAGFRIVTRIVVEQLERRATTTTFQQQARGAYACRHADGRIDELLIASQRRIFIALEGRGVRQIKLGGFPDHTTFLQLLEPPLRLLEIPAL